MFDDLQNTPQSRKITQMEELAATVAGLKSEVRDLQEQLRLVVSQKAVHDVSAISAIQPIPSREAATSSSSSTERAHSQPKKGSYSTMSAEQLRSSLQYKSTECRQLGDENAALRERLTMLEVKYITTETQLKHRMGDASLLLMGGRAAFGGIGKEQGGLTNNLDNSMASVLETYRRQKELLAYRQTLQQATQILRGALLGSHYGELTATSGLPAHLVAPTEACDTACLEQLLIDHSKASAAAIRVSNYNGHGADSTSFQSSPSDVSMRSALREPLFPSSTPIARLK